MFDEMICDLSPHCLILYLERKYKPTVLTDNIFRCIFFAGALKKTDTKRFY